MATPISDKQIPTNLIGSSLSGQGSQPDQESRIAKTAVSAMELDLAPKDSASSLSSRVRTHSAGSVGDSKDPDEPAFSAYIEDCLTRLEQIEDNEEIPSWNGRDILKGVEMCVQNAGWLSGNPSDFALEIVRRLIDRNQEVNVGRYKQQFYDENTTRYFEQKFRSLEGETRKLGKVIKDFETWHKYYSETPCTTLGAKQTREPVRSQDVCKLTISFLEFCKKASTIYSKHPSPPESEEIESLRNALSSYYSDRENFQNKIKIPTFLDRFFSNN